MSLARRPLALVLAAVLLVACGRGSGSATSAPTNGDKRYVAVLARHVRHQGEVAAAAHRRLATVDDTAAAVAARVVQEATTRADELDGVLRTWGVDGQAEAVLFAGAVGLSGSAAPGTIVYGCSLAAPVDDVTQVQQLEADRVAGRYGQLAMAGAVEARTLAAADAAGRTGQSKEHGAAIDAWERDVLRAVAPFVPATDQAYARRGGEPAGP